MTPVEFTARAMEAPGIPWRRWRAGWDGADCYGLCVLYWREVLGIELGPVPQTDIALGFAGMQGWTECQPVPGATGFMAWVDDAPTHCGIVLAGQMLLHSRAGDFVPEHGSVRVTRLQAMQRMCPDIRFYRFDAA